MAEVSDSCSGEEERLQATTTGGARAELEGGRMTHTRAFCKSKLRVDTLPYRTVALPWWSMLSLLYQSARVGAGGVAGRGLAEERAGCGSMLGLASMSAAE